MNFAYALAYSQISPFRSLCPPETGGTSEAEGVDKPLTFPFSPFTFVRRSGWIVFRFHFSVFRSYGGVVDKLLIDKFLFHTESTELTDFFLCYATLALELTQLTRVEPTETLLSPTLTPRQQNDDRFRCKAP